MFFFRFDSLVSASLDFLSSICQRPHYSALFRQEGMLKTMCQDVIIKNLMLRGCDFEQFEDEPIEFLKNDIEGSHLCPPPLLDYLLH